MAWHDPPGSDEQTSSNSQARIPKEVYIIISFFIVIIFLTIGLGGNPKVSSLVMWILLAGYLILAAGDYTEVTWMVALAMAALHIGSIISYYSRPLILPLVIIERSHLHKSINIDFVQIIILIEVLRHLSKEKVKKVPYEIQEPGAQGDAAVV